MHRSGVFFGVHSYNTAYKKVKTSERMQERGCWGPGGGGLKVGALHIHWRARGLCMHLVCMGRLIACVNNTAAETVSVKTAVCASEGFGGPGAVRTRGQARVSRSRGVRVDKISHRGRGGGKK